MGWIVKEVTDKHLVRVNTDTGETKSIALSSDAQHDYMNSLRAKLGKEPLRGKLPVFKASKSINAMLKKIERAKETGKLPLPGQMTIEGNTIND